MAFGFAEVLPDRVRLLAQIAERAEEIDVDAGRRAPRASAEEMLQAAQAGNPTSTSSAPASSLMKALTRLQVASQVQRPRRRARRRRRN